MKVLREAIMFLLPHAAVLALALMTVCVSAVEVSAQQLAARPTVPAVTSDQIEATLIRLLTVPLTDSESTKPLRATLAAAEVTPPKAGDQDAAKRMKVLVETGRYQIDSWEALNAWIAANKEWQAKPGTVAEKGPPPVYTPPSKPGTPVAAPPIPVDVDKFDAVADAKAFALYRELDCLDTGLSQLQATRTLALQYGNVATDSDDALICPIVARCEALTRESLAGQLMIREDLPMLSGAMKKCEGSTAKGDSPLLEGVLRRIARLSMPEEVNRLRSDYIAARIATEPAKLAGLPTQ